MAARRSFPNIGLLLVFMATLFLAVASAQAAQTVVVQTDVANLRQGPGTSYGKIGEAYRGERLPVQGSTEDWFKVSKDGRLSWIYGPLVRVETTAATPSTTVTQAVVTGSVVNLRSGPGTDQQVIGQVSRDMRMDVVLSSGDWVKVKTSAGTYGWVAKSLVCLEAKTSASGSSGVAEYEVVTKTAVTLRSGPGNSYSQAGNVPAGTVLGLLGKSGQWVKVRTGGGGVAWIAGWLVTVRAVSSPSDAASPTTPSAAVPPVSSPTLTPVPVVPTPSTPTDSEQDNDGYIGRLAQVAVDVADLRSGPAAGQRAVASASRGSMLPVIGAQGGWLQVRTPGGTVGWIDRDQVSIGDEAPAEQGDESGEEPLEVKTEVVGNRTKVTITAPTKMDYGVFLLRDPNRVVVDLTGLTGDELPADKKVDSTVLNGLRFGWQAQSSKIRVVCDLESSLAKTRYKARLSSNQRSLVLEFWLASNAIQDRTVVLDPGHGGRDPGAIGSNGLKEKDATLAISLATARLLEKQGINVVLTRSDDRALGDSQSADLLARADVANNAGADLFVSIHCNSCTSSTPMGTETYYCTAPENWAVVGQAEDRSFLAEIVQKHLLDALGRPNRGVKTANYVVLCATEMPSVLTEIAFLSNPEEEHLLAQDSFRDRAAQAIADAIVEYLAS